MISDLLDTLKDRVSDHLRMSAGWSPADPQDEWVVFPSSDRLDLVDFKLKVVTVLLVNLEEDHSMRRAEPYLRTLPDGTKLPGHPPVVLNAYVLFVSRFASYEESLRRISRIAGFFQANRVLDHDNTPALAPRIEKLLVELVTLPLSEQNHLWSMLRTAYQPSLLYKVRMVVLDDEDATATPTIQETRTNVRPVQP